MAEGKRYPPEGSRCAICGAVLNQYELHAWAESRKRKGCVTRRALCGGVNMAELLHIGAHPHFGEVYKCSACGSEFEIPEDHDLPNTCPDCEVQFDRPSVKEESQHGA